MINKILRRSYNALRYRGKKVLQAIFFEAISFGRSNVKSVYGPIFTNNKGDSTFKYYILGSYGKYYSTYLRQFSTDFCFLDIGANQGLYTIIAALNPKCRDAVAFEPVRDTYFLLENNLLLNRVGARVSPFNLAVGPACERRAIKKKEAHSGAATFRDEISFGIDDSEFVEVVGAEYLSSLFNENSASILVKIDVEGFEQEVIEEIINCSWIELVESWWVEINDEWTNLGELETLLSSVGFSIGFKTGSEGNYDVLFEKRDESE